MTGPLVPVAVVGMKAGGRQHVAAYVRIGDVALLMPEPTNPYDPNAVAVYVAPRGALRNPPDVDGTYARSGIGADRLDPTDRALLLDRQVGYLPAAVSERVAATIANDGLVTRVTDVRWHPDETVDGHRVVAGLDVEAPRPPRGARP